MAKTAKKCYLPLPLVSKTMVGFIYTGHIGEGSERVYALGLCRSDLHDEDCFNCVNSSSQAIIEKCPYQKEATDFGPPSLCIVRYSDKSFSRITDSSPAELIYNLNKITNNTDEFDQALYSLVDSLIDTAANSPPRSKFATGAKKFSEYDSIYALMECIPGQTPDDCRYCLRPAVSDYQECCSRKRGVLLLRPTCIFQYDLSPFIELTDASLPPPLPVDTFAPPPTRNMTTKQGMPTSPQ